MHWSRSFGLWDNNKCPDSSVAADVAEVAAVDSLDFVRKRLWKALPAVP